jgi:hypothetical protein
MLHEDRKQEIIRRFDKLAGECETWVKKNRYYFEDQSGYYRFLVFDGLTTLGLGRGASDLLHAMKTTRGVWKFIQVVDRILNPVACFLALCLFRVLGKRGQ